MTTERETILIVDDDKVVRQVVQRKLSSEGYHCIQAANADEAIAQLKENPVGLAILDIKMPGKSGIELLSEIKEQYPDVVVIMVTGIHDMDTALQCMRQGAFDYISKPINFEELFLTVDKALEMRKLRLIESSDRYQTFFESANDILLLIDRKGKILDVNSRLTDVGGYEREELLGKNIGSLTKLMTKKSLAIVMKNFAKRLAGFNVKPYEVEMFTKYGKVLNIEINAVAMRRGDKIVGDLAILRDVSEKRQAEKALMESEERFRTILDSASDGILLANLETKKFDIANRAICKMLGYSLEEIRNLGVSDIHPEKDLPYVTKQFEKQSRGEITLSGDIPVKRKDGSIFYADVNTSNLTIGGKSYLAGIFRDTTERKQLEQELQESRDSLIEAQQIAHIGSWDWDISKDIISYSDEFHHIFGQQIQNLAMFLNSLHSDDREFVERSVNESLRENKPYDIDYRIILPNREERVIHAQGRVTSDSAGNLDRMIGIVQDITERRQAEKVLQESEKRYRSLIEDAHDMIQSIRPDGNFIFVNRAWLQTLGYTEENLPNLNMFNIIHPESLAHCQEMFTKVMAGESVQNISATFTAKDGRKVLVEGNATPRYMGDNIVATHGIFRDVTERNQAEELFKNLASSSPVGIYIIQDKKFIYVNPQFQKYSGYSEDELLGRNSLELVFPEDREIVRQNAIHMLKGKNTTGYEYRSVNKNGDIRWVLETIAPIQYRGRRATLGNYMDITENKRADEEIKRLYEQVKLFNVELEEKIKERTKELEAAVKNAEAANQAKSEFLSSMSHELRTPLTAIIGFSQVLVQQYFGELNDKQTEYVKDILESGEHLLSLINDILDLAKVEAGKDELELSRLNVKELLENSLVMIKEKALKHSLNLDTYISSDLDELFVVADERKLKQIMFNLLSNAAKFTPDNERISVKGILNGSELIISVTDTGIGIDDSEQGKIFDEFYQANSGPKDKTPGTGLGLSLTKHFVEMHGGKIWVESEGKEKGSTFSFSLPIREVDKKVEAIGVAVNNN